jgi:hypothetical protein
MVKNEEYLKLLNEQKPNALGSEALKELQAFVAQVATYVGEPARCELILGGLVSYGQEYRAVLSFPLLNYSQTLFRAYVSLRDQAITFHPTGGKIETDIKNLRERLLELLKMPALIETLQYIKDKAETFRKTGHVS